MKPMFALFMGVACLSTAVVGLSTTAALIVVEHAGAAWSGLPNAVLVLGSAAGSLWSGALAARYGRRLVLVLMYGAAVAGALISFAGVLGGSVLALVAGMPLIGFGNSGAQLSRYTAADLSPEHRKGFALSTMVWAGTVGAVAGPALIAPAAARAEAADLPALSGPIAAGAMVVVIAVIAVATLPRGLSAPAEGVPRRERMSVRNPVILGPLVAMVGAQLAMVAVMTMTPVQLHQHGQGLDVVGWVLSAHLVGMFALAPLSGWIADRWGGRAAIFGGIGTLTSRRSPRSAPRIRITWESRSRCSCLATAGTWCSSAAAACSAAISRPLSGRGRRAPSTPSSGGPRPRPACSPGSCSAWADTFWSPSRADCARSSRSR
ncbi:Major Facilitator Superfamily protein [Amycolatopsis lurida]|uniref:MFS transporter n=1 Tax=Amycolatopsis lurida TaxID=31959 RepID=UPI000894ACF2|nr:MFS transporter [Amycolatopsis lurida]SEB33261.1 Major Facilitator Superfamily protein [Amycolatopsis lurida]